jgi:heme A synthase
MRPSRIFTNLVGFMLFVQVILGGIVVLVNSAVLGFHLIWGVITFAVLIVATALAVRDYGTKSTLFKIAIAAIVDFVIQGVLGFLSFGSDVIVVVHLTNAFVLAVVVTYMISFADSSDRTAAHPQPAVSVPTGK